MRPMRLPCTNTSPLYGGSPLPSKMRTLVNKTLAMLSPLRPCHRALEKPAQMRLTIGGALGGHPMTAARQTFYLRIAEPAGHLARNLHRRDRIFVPGDQQRRHVDVVDLRCFCCGPRLARARITLRDRE